MGDDEGRQAVAQAATRRAGEARSNHSEPARESPSSEQQKLTDKKGPDGLPIWCIRDGWYRILYTIKRPVKEDKRKKRKPQDGSVSIYEAWHRSRDYKEDAD